MLSGGVVCVILRLAVLIEYWRVTDRQTDIRRRLIPALASVARVKMIGGAAKFGPPCRIGDHNDATREFTACLDIQSDQ